MKKSRLCAALRPAAAAVTALLIASGAAQAADLVRDQRPGFYGEPAPAAAVGRVINLDADARWINVTQNETVQIQRGGKTFNWTFSTWMTFSFDLAQVAPSGFVAPGTVRVYLQADPRYSGA